MFPEPQLYTCDVSLMVKIEKIPCKMHLRIRILPKLIRQQYTGRRLLSIANSINVWHGVGLSSGLFSLRASRSREVFVGCLDWDETYNAREAERDEQTTFKYDFFTRNSSSTESFCRESQVESYWMALMVALLLSHLFTGPCINRRIESLCPACKEYFHIATRFYFWVRTAGMWRKVDFFCRPMPRDVWKQHHDF